MGAFGGGHSDFECSCFRYCSSSFFSPNFTKQRRTARFSLSKSTGIDFLSGFIDTPNPRFSPRVSNTSFDTDSWFSHRLWHFKLLGFRGRSFGSVVVFNRCITFRLTECLVSAMIPNFLWQMSYSFCRVVSTWISFCFCSLLLLRIFLFLAVLSPFRVFRLVFICPIDFFFFVFHLVASLIRTHLRLVFLFFCCCCCCIGCIACSDCDCDSCCVGVYRCCC